MNVVLAALFPCLGPALLAAGLHCTAVPDPVTPPAAPEAVLAPEPAPEPEPALAQDPPEPALAPEVDPAEVAALALLDEAARFQRGDTPRGRAESFHGRFYVLARNVQDGSSINAHIERWYTREPERMVTTRVDSLVDSNSTVGFDSEKVWFKDNTSGNVVVYSDDRLTYQTDLELMDAQLQLTPLILDAAVLDALIPTLQDPRLVGEPTSLQVGRREEDVRMVRRLRAWAPDDLFDPDPSAPPPMPGDPPPLLQVELAIDVESGALWSFSVETLGRRDTRRLELRFKNHVLLPSGLRVPATTLV